MSRIYRASTREVFVIASWSLLAAGLMGLMGCQSSGSSTAGAAASGQTKAQLFDGLGTHRRAVTTNSPGAQKYFDQALVWTYSFNHDEAIRSYKEAARLDPTCAMAWWGVALCNGPHINNPVMDDDHSRAAWEALGNARARAANASPVEKALIDALGARYANTITGPIPHTPEERAPFDQAYAAAMKKVYEQYPNDNDVAALYAESLMDLHPWDLWTHEGAAKPGTEEIIAVLEGIMRRDPNHPGANHLYIHTVEASPRADRAVAAADRLRTLVPASGHMVHMPAHIDVRVGKWGLASDQNERALVVDRDYRRRSPRQGFYNVYMLHNWHFLSWSAMMEGRREVSLKAARDMVGAIPAEFSAKTPALTDPFVQMPTEVLMRFGRWDEILKQPEPSATVPITRAMWRFSRGVAFAAKGDVGSAEVEQREFRAAVEKVPPDALMMINKGRTVLSIAEHMLAGEIAYRRGSIDEAVSQLTEAVRIEDSLKYMEPPDWIQPVRHTLGAVLLDSGRPAEAEAVYRADLVKWPENGWALYGLSKCLKARGSPEMAEVEARFKKAWARADTRIEASCLCVKPGSGR